MRLSAAAPIALNAEGQVFRVVTKFTGRKGKTFRVGVGSIPDFCDGYEVHLRDGPQRKRYPPMIVHVHYSDEARTKVERAHFKRTHSARDHNHVLVKSGQQGAVLAILT